MESSRQSALLQIRKEQCREQKNPKEGHNDCIAVIEFIKFYNNERPKDKFGFLSPVEFRLKNPQGTYPVPISKSKGTSIDGEEMRIKI